MATIINPITTVLLNREEFALKEFQRFPFKYILEDDGTITYYSTLSVGRFVQSHEAKIPGLGKVRTNVAPGASFQPLANGTKIPGIMFEQIRTFFLDVMAMGPGTYEAQTFIVWNSTSEDYRIIIPKQTVSAAAVKYDIQELLGEGDTIICDIHSHNDMGAFFSGTDDADDKKNPWISGVFGKLSTSMENKFRFNDGCGRHFEMKAEDVFEFGAKVATPSEWLEQVTISVYTPPKVNNVRKWGDAYKMADSSLLEQEELWTSPANGKLDPEWASIFDPQDDLYDSIVESLTDASEIEVKAVVSALVSSIEDPKKVHQLSERESAFFMDIDYTIRNMRDKSMALNVLGQISTIY